MISSASRFVTNRRRFLSKVVAKSMAMAGAGTAGRFATFCCEPSSASAFAGEGGDRTTSGDRSNEFDGGLDRACELDRAILAAVDFLLRKRDDDGLWRSDVYGPFRDVTALTPRILWGLNKVVRIGLPAPQKGITLRSVHAGRKWATTMLKMHGAKVSVMPLAYPVYFAADVVSLLSCESGNSVGDLNSESALDSGFEPDRGSGTAVLNAWRAYLLKLQLSPELGWEASDPRCGGWSYAKARPQRPAVIQQLSPLSEPNISSTAAALDALSLSPSPASSVVRRRALAFLCRLQNSDGGFRFVLDDFVRNKAGASERQRGQVEFHSYGSATCDGIRGLLHCGLDQNDARVVKARNWLDRNFNANSHPGRFSEEREYSREAVYYYYCRSLAVCIEHFPSLLRDGIWLKQIASCLLARQRDDGAWSNPVVDVREDDPLVATPLALETLLICRSRCGKASAS